MKTIYYLLFLITLNSQASQIDLSKDETLQQHQLKNKGTANFITVGSDANCDYNNLQTALNTANIELRLATNMTFSSAVISNQVTINGGFNNCTDALNGIYGLDKSFIDAGGVNFGVHIVAQNITVKLNNLIIQNGSKGVFVDETGVELFINDSIIQNNQLTSGIFGSSGLDIQLQGTTFLENVLIRNNDTHSYGGGISCKFQTVMIFGNSSIEYNSAFNKGGGIFAQFCNLTIVGGDISSTGINNNSAIATKGAGLYLEQSYAYITGGKYSFNSINYGDLSQAYKINNNMGTLSNSHGAGIYADLSTVELINIQMIGNHTAASGGAIYAANNSQILVSRSIEPCWSSLGCNLFDGNLADNAGGVFMINSGSDANIQSSRIINNRAAIAVVLNAGSNTTDVKIESSFISENGTNGASPYSDETLLRVNGAQVTIAQSSVINNFSVNSVIDFISGTLDLENSIIYNPLMSAPYYSQSGSAASTDLCLFVDDANNSSTSQVTAIDSNEFDLGFVDAHNGDYHLTSNSFAIDACGELTPMTLIDIDGESFAYDQELINGIDPNMANDAGADEITVNIDIIFKNGFEAN